MLQKDAAEGAVSWAAGIRTRHPCIAVSLGAACACAVTIGVASHRHTQGSLRLVGDNIHNATIVEWVAYRIVVVVRSLISCVARSFWIAKRSRFKKKNEAFSRLRGRSGFEQTLPPPDTTRETHDGKVCCWVVLVASLQACCGA